MKEERSIRRSHWFRALTTVAILLVGMGVTWVGFRMALGTPTPFFVVSSGSMVPALNVGDVIITKNGASFRDVDVDDTIVFYRPAYGGRVLALQPADVLL